ncbi:uncharacterized protein CTRU02_204442 [Colletotrichum truncatum]|uniref:Uncharacterized protein n=1 Tax=Colletotrichum truncatum TaxID=5467 RepID=A0ACC3ZC80_COLTU|nr:uncharacterized protein CTRU02_14429 [Colletotrichum truncatum]KAF6782242.1 hypothetical protein CTRU02_14429 [Colletotrichum truncatum]
MKFSAAAVLALVSVAFAAPNPEGQANSIKLSKENVDAIVAAAPNGECYFDFSCGCVWCT